MHLGQYSKYAPFIMRLGLAFVFFYAGISALINPELWIGFIPSWVQNILPFSPEFFLKIHAVADIAIGAMLLFGIFIRFTALAGAVFLLSIVVLSGLDEITFRDVGLIGCLVALFFMKSNHPS